MLVGNRRLAGQQPVELEIVAIAHGAAEVGMGTLGLVVLIVHGWPHSCCAAALRQPVRRRVAAKL